MLFISISLSAPATEEVITVVLNEFEHLPDNGYRFHYELSDGQIRIEKGTFKLVNDVPILVVEGTYSFVADDGKKYVVNYIADENGYRAEEAPGTFENAFIGTQGLDPNIIISLAGWAHFKF